MNKKTKKIATIGILVSLAIILSVIKIFQLPYGGSITLFSMVPIVILSYKYGIKWGLFAGLIYSVLQAVLGATASQAFAGMYDPENAAKSVLNIVLMALLDYIIAFTVLGLAGMFKGKIKNDVAAITAGSTVAVLLRLVAHFFSGWILWGSYAEDFFTNKMDNAFGTFILQNFDGQLLSIIYSLVYNMSFMIPELIITILGVIVLVSTKQVRKFIVDENA